MASNKIYKGILLENLDKSVRFSHSVVLNAISDGKLETDVNKDYLKKLMNLDKKQVPSTQFDQMSALSSVVNMNYQICNGGIYQYFDNGYDKFRKPYNNQDVARLDKDAQENMLDELLSFGLAIYPEQVEKNQLLAEVISHFKNIFMEEEEQFEWVESSEEKEIWDDDLMQYIENPDYEEPYEQSVGYEEVLRNDDGFDDKYFQVCNYLETLIEGYAQYLAKSIELEKNQGQVLSPGSMASSISLRDFLKCFDFDYHIVPPNAPGEKELRERLLKDFSISDDCLSVPMLGLIDLQGGNFGNIEGDRFVIQADSLVKNLIERLDVYIHDVISDFEDAIEDMGVAPEGMNLEELVHKAKELGIEDGVSYDVAACILNPELIDISAALDQCRQNTLEKECLDQKMSVAGNRVTGEFKIMDENRERKGR